MFAQCWKVATAHQRESGHQAVLKLHPAIVWQYHYFLNERDQE